MSEPIQPYGDKEKDFSPPTTRAQAYAMVEPLDPLKIVSEHKKRLAYSRLINFIDLLLPE